MRQMDLGKEKWRDWGRRCLGPAGRVYAAAMRARAGLYATGVLGCWRPPRPCVSVGNISVGGSGKTPLAEWILQSAAEGGLRPALLSRGYKACPPYYPYLVRPDTRAAEAGDEPAMLARSCPEALVVIDYRRDRGGRWIWDRSRPDLFVLDDGMQHLRVQRDLDLVLLSPEDLRGEWNRVLPSGPWREGKKGLQRADAFLVSTLPGREEEALIRLRSRLPQNERPVFCVHLEAAGLRRLDGQGVEHPSGEPYLLFSGVGRPERVKASTTRLMGEPPQRHLVYPDHHPYSGEDWDRIRRTADELGCRSMVCTTKDAVKLEGLAPDQRLACLDLRVTFGAADNTRLAFPRWLEQNLGVPLSG